MSTDTAIHVRGVTAAPVRFITGDGIAPFAAVDIHPLPAKVTVIVTTAAEADMMIDAFTEAKRLLAGTGGAT